MNRVTTYEERRQALEALAYGCEGSPAADAIRDALTDMAEYRHALIQWAWRRVENAAILHVSPFGGGCFTTDLYPRQPAMPYLEAAPRKAILETIVFNVFFDGKRWRATCEGIDL